MMSAIIHAELGKKSTYDAHYNPNRLVAIARKEKRDEINIDSNAPLPFYGYDEWNHYEVSWLDQKGKPLVAFARIIYPCHSPNIIESKSMKLYFNSLNNTKFVDAQMVQYVLEKDLSQSVGSKVTVAITPLNNIKKEIIPSNFSGKCIDELDIECSVYTVTPAFLKTETILVEAEVLYSDLFKSNCLVTNQPDWASIQIKYSGTKINEESLLKYLISYRNHNEFHEQCVERIFMHLMHYCQPTKLTVSARFTRRGGIDINPIRSTDEIMQQESLRLYRQ